VCGLKDYHFEVVAKASNGIQSGGALTTGAEAAAAVAAAFGADFLAAGTAAVAPAIPMF
jgi:hypothetical protein